ncbi:MAG: SPFH domain-containing protein [Planctomycetota bacterium]
MLGGVLASSSGGIGGASAVLLFVAIGIALFVSLIVIWFLASRVQRCPPNRVLVIWGQAGRGGRKCYNGGLKIVLPVVQQHAYMSLEPLVIDIPLEGALSLNNIRVNVPATFTVRVSPDSVLMEAAAENLLGKPPQAIRELAQDIILGQLRLVIATLSIEEINKDREKFESLIRENVTQEINKIGLELINVNIRDITDESGYIRAIGQRAAADAINKAKVEVAQADRDGATGEAIANREKAVSVAQEQAAATEGEKSAERQMRVAVSQQEAEAVSGEAEARRDQDIAVAERTAETAAASKRAEQQQRVAVADAEARAVEGENTSQGQIAEYNAKLAEVRAESTRRADVAEAEAQEAILRAEREQELARLAKEELAPQEIEKQRIEIAAEAEAEKQRREARGEADAVLARYQAEAEGVQKVLEAKAEGYRKLMAAAADNPQVAPTLLLIEQLPELVAQQVKAIQNLRIDKITVWDSGRGGGRPGGTIEGKDGVGGATSDFLAGLIGSLPPVHELARQAGIELPSALGRVQHEPRPHAPGPRDHKSDPDQPDAGDEPAAT